MRLKIINETFTVCKVEDYILTKAENFEKAIKTLEAKGYEIIECITT